jgi:hypothetical protein
MRFQLDVGEWLINQPPTEGQALFELPRTQLGTYRFVDMAAPNFVPPGGTLPVDAAQPAPQLPSASLPERYRGWR